MDVIHELSPSKMECTDFKLWARTASRPIQMPVGILRCRGAIHATARKNMHVPCQRRCCFSKKWKTMFFSL